LNFSEFQKRNTQKDTKKKEKLYVKWNERKQKTKERERDRARERESERGGGVAGSFSQSPTHLCLSMYI
jgi:hypothetical protein